MMRMILLIAAGITLAGPALSQTLRSEAAIAGPIVTLGDLVEGAGEHADIAVFRAPDPGVTGDVAADQIREIARAHGIEVDIGERAAIAVTRMSRAIEISEITASVEAALRERLGNPVATVSVAVQRPKEQVHLPVSAVGPILIEGLSWSQANGGFSAQIVVATADGGSERRAIAGNAVETRAVLMTTRDLQRGDILSDGDLELVQRPASEFSVQSLSDETLAIGQQARRGLRAGQPLRAGDVEPPVLVRRGDGVTIVHSVGALTLTLRGEAQRDGIRGDQVPVVNLQSRRTLQATVIGRGQVSVVTPRVLATAAQRSEIQ